MKNDRFVDGALLTPQEVADILKIAKNTVYALIKRGELNAFRVGNKMRISVEDVENYKHGSSSIKAAQTAEIQQPLHHDPGKAKQSNFRQSQSTRPSDGTLVICGQDMALDILARHLELSTGVKCLRSYVGSYSGLYSLYHDASHIATAHLYDAATGTYNVEYVKRMLPGTPCVVIRFIKRMQGFYVSKGNPKGVSGWNDLKRTDLRIANREKGSGSRVLLDEMLKTMGIRGRDIKGYSEEYESHLAVASAVSRGICDLGIGNEAAGLSVRNVDFIPLQEEFYDIIIKKDDMDSALMAKLVEILKSGELKDEIDGIGYYDTDDMGMIVHSD